RQTEKPLVPDRLPIAAPPLGPQRPLPEHHRTQGQNNEDTTFHEALSNEPTPGPGFPAVWGCTVTRRGSNSAARTSARKGLLPLACPPSEAALADYPLPPSVVSPHGGTGSDRALKAAALPPPIHPDRRKSARSPPPPAPPRARPPS